MFAGAGGGKGEWSCWGVGDSNKLRSAKPPRTSFFQSTKIPARVPRVKNAALSGSGNVRWDGGG